MEHHHTIAIGSPLWWTGIIFSIAVISILITFGKKQDRKNQILIAKILAISIAFSEITRHLISIANGEWAVTSHLPLQLCAISFWISVFLLFRRKPLLYEYIVMLGIPGALQSFITPEMTSGYSNFLVFNYYFTHTGIIFTGLYLTIVLGMRPEKGSWIKVFLFGQVILIFVGLINWLIGANYIYLCQKPLAANPFIIGDWPWYLIGLEVLGLAHILLFYFLFRYWVSRKNISR